MNNNIQNFRYFIFGHKSYDFIKKTTKVKSLENKLDLVNWFINIQEDSALNQLSDFNGHLASSTNFELHLGKANRDVTRTYGYIDTKFLDEMMSQHKIHNREREVLLRHLIFYSFFQTQNINPIDLDFSVYDKYLDLNINLNIIKKMNTSNKIYFALNTKHLSNPMILEPIKTKQKTSNYFFHKSIKEHHHQIAEHIVLFGFKETETTVPLSGTIDRVLQESAWRGRYKTIPTLVKELDNPMEFVNRIGMNSYKADINLFDYKWWEFHHNLSTFLTVPFNDKSNALEIPVQILNNLNSKTLDISLINFNALTINTSYIDYNSLIYLTNYKFSNIEMEKSSNSLVISNINLILWKNFNILSVLLNNTMKVKNRIILSGLYTIHTKNINYDKIIRFLRKPVMNNQINNLNLYKQPEDHMLHFIYLKFKNIFFLRASIGANWGFLDVDLLEEEQEEREKDKHYKEYDDNRKFYYFLFNKDISAYDDTTFTTNVKYKRFMNDVYKPNLVSPHKRPYNWLQIPEMSFSPFFSFLKNASFMWFDLFEFNFNVKKKTGFDDYFKKQFLERFLYSNNFTYTYQLKQIFSWKFLSVLFSPASVLKFSYTSNMEYKLKTNTLAFQESSIRTRSDLLKINNLLKDLNESIFLPDSFNKFYNITQLNDIYNYSDFYLQSYVRRSASQIEHRKSNQMRFNFMYKLGLSREHSWFFLYNSPVFFKQAIAYQAWVKERVPNLYSWEHDNPFLIQQIFRPHSLDLIQDMSLYKYKADMLQLLLLGFKEIVFSEIFLMENYHTKEYTTRSVFEIPKFTVPFFLFDSDLYMISQIPDTILYEHISAFGIPALERQWEFHELTFDLSKNQQTSEWPDYLFNSEAYAKILWTSRTTKNIFNKQEYTVNQDYKLEQSNNLLLQNLILQKKLIKLPEIFFTDMYKIYSYLFKKILLSQDLKHLKNLTTLLAFLKRTNSILYYNILFFLKQVFILSDLHSSLILLKRHKKQNYFIFYEKLYLYSFFFNSQSLYIKTQVPSHSVLTTNDFYVVYIFYLYVLFFLLN